MVLNNLIPFKRGSRGPLARRHQQAHPIMDLQRQMNSVFENFFGDFSHPMSALPDRWADGFAPSVDIAETDKEVTVTAELAGLDEKDIHISIQDDLLTLCGEKKLEHEENDARHYVMERSYGAFSRAIPLPAEVDDNKAEAVFRK